MLINIVAAVVSISKGKCYIICNSYVCSESSGGFRFGAAGPVVSPLEETGRSRQGPLHAALFS